jgi:hypothetical protein
MYNDRDETTGGTEAPQGVVPKDDIEFTLENPNVARAVPHTDEPSGEAKGASTQGAGTYPDIVEGSDSERTGTSWGLPASEGVETVATPEGQIPEGEGEGEAHPSRNTGGGHDDDDLDDVGAWGTMDTLA